MYSWATVLRSKNKTKWTYVIVKILFDFSQLTLVPILRGSRFNPMFCMPLASLDNGLVRCFSLLASMLVDCSSGKSRSWAAKLHKRIERTQNTQYRISSFHFVDLFLSVDCMKRHRHRNFTICTLTHAYQSNYLTQKCNILITFLYRVF